MLFEKDCVIHCAGRAHKVYENEYSSLEKYRLINFETTKKIAIQCAMVGVKRLIFLSSVGVLGNNTNNRKPFLYSDEPNPMEDYAISKLEAERSLLEISNNTGLEIVVIRSPIVYGPSAPGNLNRLIKLIKTRLPLPFSLINNQRSLIGVENLIDIIIRCINHPDAKGKSFLVSDGEDLSTPELIKLIASSMGIKAHLFPVPLYLLKFIGSLFGKRKEINRFVGSLRVDDSYTKEILNWTPPISVEEGIRRMVKDK